MVKNCPHTLPSIGPVPPYTILYFDTFFSEIKRPCMHSILAKALPFVLEGVWPCVGLPPYSKSSSSAYMLRGSAIMSGRGFTLCTDYLFRIMHVCSIVYISDYKTKF